MTIDRHCFARTDECIYKYVLSTLNRVLVHCLMLRALPIIDGNASVGISTGGMTKATLGEIDRPACPPPPLELSPLPTAAALVLCINRMHTSA